MLVPFYYARSCVCIISHVPILSCKNPPVCLRPSFSRLTATWDDTYGYRKHVVPCVFTMQGSVARAPHDHPMTAEAEQFPGRRPSPLRSRDHNDGRGRVVFCWNPHGSCFKITTPRARRRVNDRDGEAAIRVRLQDPAAPEADRIDQLIGSARATVMVSPEPGAPGSSFPTTS
jgi:hypothetical protein